MDARACVGRGLGEGEADIAVLAPASPVAVVGAQPILAGRLAYGQQVRFLGFRLGGSAAVRS